jgi:hypothetical protein
MSHLVAPGPQCVDDGTVASAGQETTNDENLLDVHVFALWAGEESGLGTDVDRVLAAVADFDRSDRFEQGEHGVPFDAATRRVLEQLEQRSTMMGIGDSDRLGV